MTPSCCGLTHLYIFNKNQTSREALLATQYNDDIHNQKILFKFKSIKPDLLFCSSAECNDKNKINIILVPRIFAYDFLCGDSEPRVDFFL